MVIKSVGFGGYQKNSVAFITPADLIVKSIELKILSNSKKTQSIDICNSRLAMNLLPVNAPKNATENSYQRDGPMRTDPNGGGGPNYWPNSFNGPEPDISAKEPAIEISGQADRYQYTHLNDDFVQPGNLYRDSAVFQGRSGLWAPGG